MLHFLKLLWNIFLLFKIQSNLCFGHLWTMATCQQGPAWIPCPTKPTINLPSILNNGHPLNNNLFWGVPRVVVVHRFDCISKVYLGAIQIICDTFLHFLDPPLLPCDISATPSPPPCVTWHFFLPKKEAFINLY